MKKFLKNSAFRIRALVATFSSLLGMSITLLGIGAIMDGNIVGVIAGYFLIVSALIYFIFIIYIQYKFVWNKGFHIWLNDVAKRAKLRQKAINLKEQEEKLALASVKTGEQAKNKNLKADNININI